MYIVCTVKLAYLLIKLIYLPKVVKWLVFKWKLGITIEHKNLRLCFAVNNNKGTRRQVTIDIRGHGTFNSFALCYLTVVNYNVYKEEPQGFI